MGWKVKGKGRGEREGKYYRKMEKEGEGVKRVECTNERKIKKYTVYYCHSLHVTLKQS